MVIGMLMTFVPFPTKWLTSGPGPSLLGLAAKTSIDMVGTDGSAHSRGCLGNKCGMSESGVLFPSAVLMVS